MSLRASFPGIEVETELLSDIKFDRVLAWDAFDECEEFPSDLIGPQNRLFDKFDVSATGSFSKFRKQAEKLLPDYFEDAIEPWDEGAKDRLDFYFSEDSEFPSSYFEIRNGMLGTSFSTQFSPFLASGVLDVKYLYNRVKDYEMIKGANKSTYWIIFELLWRDFFYWHYKKVGPDFFRPDGLADFEDFRDPVEYSFSKLRSFSKDPFFISALNELGTTGYPSNRTRQLFASFCINDLGLDWLAGASLYEKNLIDYDVFSNYGNWMYLAGVGVDPRGKRYFKTEKQLELYDPTGAYIKKWI